MKRLLLVLLFLFSIVPATAELETSQSTPFSSSSDQVHYTIQQDNELSFFYEYEDGSKESFLRLPLLPNGNIIAPKLGELHIKGLTHTELIALLSQKFQSTELAKPKFIDVLIYRVTNNVAVIGAVVRPGSYSIGDIKTVYDAIAKAGGFGDTALRTKVKVIRQRVDGTRSEYYINFPKEVFRAYKSGSGVGEEAYLVKEGDLIWVPKSKLKQSLKFTLGLLQVATIGVISGVVSVIIN